MEKIYHSKTNKKAGVAILISDKAYFTAKTIISNKEYFIMIKG